MSLRFAQFLKQLKLAFKPIRVVATIIFIASIIMVMVAAFPLDSDVRPCPSLSTSESH